MGSVEITSSTDVISLLPFYMDERTYDTKSVIDPNDLSFIYSASRFSKNAFGNVSVPVGVWLTGSPLLWMQGYSGKDCNVAVIDSGISPDHPDLQNVVKRVSYVGDNEYYSLHMHGTHVAGTIGANGNLKGVAPNVNLYDYRIFDVAGRTPNGALENALIQAADDGCQVINLSLGRPQSTDSLKRAVKYATDKGCTLIVAAGNESENLRWNDDLVSYPANYSSVVSVASIDYHIDTGRINFSDTKFSNRNKEVDLCADGYRVLSTIPGKSYGTFTGTSMACPHVSGIAAILHEKAHVLKRDDHKVDLYSLLMSYSVPIDVSDLVEDDGKDKITGAGLSTFLPQIPSRKINRGEFFLPDLNINLVT